LNDSADRRNHFTEENIPDGRPWSKAGSTRRVLEAALWILNTGEQWHMNFDVTGQLSLR
jgi:hypothetical protein